MKRNRVILSLLTGLVVFAFLTAPGWSNHCQQKKDGGACPMLDKIPNLTDAQKTSISKMCAEQQAAMKPLCEALAAAGKELQALLKNPVDPLAIDAKIDAIAQMKADLQKKCVAQYLILRAQLTEEQKAKVAEFVCVAACGMGCMGGGCQMKCGDAQGQEKHCAPKGCATGHFQKGCPKSCAEKK